MATLEKIRSKSVLLIIVIGVALLAFIVGDALTNSQNLFGNRTTVAQVGDVKVEIDEFQRKREELNNRYETMRRQNPAEADQFDTQLLTQLALSELVNEKLLDKGAKALGLRTTGDQLRFYMMENVITADMNQMIASLNEAGLSVSTPQQAYELIFNPKRNGLTEAQVAPYQRAWIAMEENTKQLINRNTYQRLVMGTIKANDLDKKAIYNDYVTTASVAYAFKPFDNLDEKTYPVSDVEKQKAFDKEKNQFKVDEPTKAVSFIAVSISPSNADIQAAQKLAQTTRNELASPNGVSKNLKKEGVSVNRRHLRASDLGSTQVKDFVTAAAPGDVDVVYQGLDGFTVVKMGKRTNEVDSVVINLVTVAGGALPDRVLTALNGGLSVDSLTTRFSPDSVMAQTNQQIPLFAANGPTQAIEPAQLDSLRGAGGKYIKIFNSTEGSVLAKLVRQSAPVEVFEFDEATYELHPSTATIAAERDKLQKFLASNTTAKSFAKNAAAAGYTAQDLALTQSISAVPVAANADKYYPESRQVVRWVMIEGNEGDVSHIYECKDATAPALYAVAVNAEYDDYIPMTDKDLQAYLTERVRRDKAGDAWVKQYAGKGKNVSEMAAAMNVEAQQTDALRFNSNNGVGEPKVVGRIMGTKANAPVALVKGDNGIYAFQIVSTATERFPFNDNQYTQQYYMMVNPRIDAMLRGNGKIKNNAYKFESGD